MKLIGHRQHFASEHVHCREQGGHAIALVIVGHRLVAAALERQAWLGAIQGLNLRLLIAAQHQGVLRGRKVEANDVLKLVDELWVVGELEGLDPMRPQTVLAPDTCDRRRVGAQVRSQAARAPLSRVARTFLKRDAYYLCHMGGYARRTRAPRASCILQQPSHALHQKACTPACYQAAFGIEPKCNLFVLETAGREQNDARAQLHACLHALAPGESAKLSIIVGGQQDGLGNSHDNDLPIGHCQATNRYISSAIYGALH